MMKNHKLFGAIACSVIALTISSCGKIDKIERFPEGTSMIKMMDEDNGGTTLGNSNVYMTSSGNFKSNNLPILDCGKKSGIGDIGLPDFTNMAPEVAVIPGHGYVICDSDNVKEFPSRKKAIREDALMYRVYVDSWIQTDGKNVGPMSISCLAALWNTGRCRKWTATSEHSLSTWSAISPIQSA